jgi:ankyrin repeat protein
MSSAFRRALPAHADLEQQKKLAKELLRAYRAGDAEAAARIREELPDKRDISLTDAQYVLAREYGSPNWRELKDRIGKQRVAMLPPIEQFKRAVHSRDAQSLGRVLAQHADVRASINAPIFGFDSTALVSAAGSNVEIVDVLLEYGADPNKKSEWWAGGFHPLYGASSDVAERLIAAGAVIDACAAAHLDKLELLKDMIAADPSRVHERGGDGKMPLHFARSRAVVDLLLASGADIDARDIDHRSTAAEWMLGDDPDEARLDLATYLVERGAHADIFLVAALGLTDRARAMLQANPDLLRLRTSQGDYGEKKPSSYHVYQWTLGPNRSPLQVAARYGQTETLAAMEQFATAEERLLLACHRGDRDKALAIVRANEGIIAKLGPVDRRALTDEAWAANAPAVELMLELGFDPSETTGSGPTGGTALHCAAWEGSVACVAALLAHPSGRTLIEARDRTYHGTPLGWTTHGSLNCGNPHADHAEVARQLIAAGATVDPNAEWHASEAVQAVIEDALSK